MTTNSPPSLPRDAWWIVQGDDLFVEHNDGRLTWAEKAVAVQAAGGTLLESGDAAEAWWQVRNPRPAVTAPSGAPQCAEDPDGSRYPHTGAASS